MVFETVTKGFFAKTLLRGDIGATWIWRKNNSEVPKFVRIISQLQIRLGFYLSVTNDSI